MAKRSKGPTIIEKECKWCHNKWKLEYKYRKRVFCSRSCANYYNNRDGSWNKGLTKENNDSLKQMSDNIKSGYDSGRKNWNAGIEMPQWVKEKLSKSALKGYKKGRKPWNTGLTIDQYPNPEKTKENFSNGWYTEKRMKSFKYQNTGPEKIMKKLLEDMKIEFIHQFRIKKIYDFLLPKFNILIEVDGNWHHCNPLTHPEPIHEIQIAVKENDIIKNRIAKENGFKLLRFWEYDINNNLEDVKKKLLEELK
jgi:very-short-patch-repair endonuclease